MNSEASQNNETTLFDFLLVICENIKLLVAGPLIAGIVALSVTSFGPQRYVSQATILLQPSTSTLTSTPTPTPKLAASLLKTALIIDPIIDSLDLANGKSKQAVRDAVVSEINAVVDKAGLLQIEVSAPSALAAQELATALIESLLESTKPSKQERQELEKKLLFAENKFKSVSILINQLEVEAGKLNGKFTSRSDVGTKLLALSESQARYSQDVSQISKAIMGLSRNVIVQSPSLPSEANKEHTVVLAVLSVFFLLLIFVCLRQAWEASAAAPESAQKKLRLLRSFGLKTSENVR